MADDGVVVRKLKEFAAWAGSFAPGSAPAQPGDAPREDEGLVTWTARDPPSASERTDLRELEAEFAHVDRRIAQLEQSIAAEEAMAREAVGRYRGKPSSKWPQTVRIRVNGHIKTKNAYMQSLEQAHTMRAALQKQIHTIQNAASQRSYMRAMRSANKTLNVHATDSTLYEAENLVEEQRELEDRARELTSHIARPQIDLDDDELADELESLFSDSAAPGQLLELDLPDVAPSRPDSMRQPATPSTAQSDLMRLAEMM
jgi:hypothetical protein